MANIKNGIVGYLEGVRGLPGKDGNPGVWVGTEPPESSEYEVWVNPYGEPFTAEWENVENKPFETLSDDFDVDSEGSLHVVGGTGGASSWEDLEDKPFESIGEGLSVDSEGVLSSIEKGLDVIVIYDSTASGILPPEDVAKLGPNCVIILGSRVDPYDGVLYNFRTYSPSYDKYFYYGQISGQGDGKIYEYCLTIDGDGTWVHTIANMSVVPNTIGHSVGEVLTIGENNSIEWSEGSSDIPDWDSLEDKPFESIGSGLSVDSDGVLSAEGGSLPFSTVGAGLEVVNDAIKMQVPVEKVEHPAESYSESFNSTDDTLIQYSGDWWEWRFDYDANQTKIDDLWQAYVDADRPAFTLTYDFTVVADQTYQITGSVNIPRSQISVPNPSTDAFEAYAYIDHQSLGQFEISIVLNNVSPYGLCFRANSVAVSSVSALGISFTEPAYTEYTTKLPAEAIDNPERLRGWNIIKTIDYNATGWPTFTQEELANIKIGDAIEVTSGYEGIWICFGVNYGPYGLEYRFYVDWSRWYGDNFEIHDQYLRINYSSGIVEGAIVNPISVISRNQSYPQYFPYDWNHNDWYMAPVFYHHNYSDYPGWVPVPQAGDGLVFNDSTGRMDMSVPVVREEDTALTLVESFDSTQDTMVKEFDYEFTYRVEDNPVKCGTLETYLDNHRDYLYQITVSYEYYGDQTETFVSPMQYQSGSEPFRFLENLPNGIREIKYRLGQSQSGDYNNGVMVICEGTDVYSISFTALVPLGTYTYTTQLPIEAIECDKTVAGTYTLQCTVDGQGNKTYSWTVIANGNGVGY